MAESTSGQDDANPVFRLATRAGNMAGYWPLSSLCVFSDLNFVSVCNVPKRRLRGMRPKGR